MVVAVAVVVASVVIVVVALAVAVVVAALAVAVVVVLAVVVVVASVVIVVVALAVIAVGSKDARLHSSLVSSFTSSPILNYAQKKKEAANLMAYQMTLVMNSMIRAGGLRRVANSGLVLSRRGYHEKGMLTADGVMADF